MVRVSVEGYPTIDAAPERTLLEVCEGAAIPMDSA